MSSVHPVNLFNTLSRSLDRLSPLVEGKVSIYCCGPTVYNFQHIGNLRTYIFEDLLVRTLRYAGYQVQHVMNITDVGHLVGDGDQGEDKMSLAVKREHKKSHEIAEFYSKVFFDDCAALNITRPDVVCKATDHIQEMIALIQQLERRGFTYVVGGNVYFDISKFNAYGELARLKLNALEAGARVDLDQNKRNPHDFVLWFTKSKFEGQELQWDSPWGRGYPGWHIECSAMSLKYLGEEFDIHCGGIDHIPVHHTNEIAQSDCAVGHKCVRIWMHGNMLVNEKLEKMAKSSGEFLTLKVVRDKSIDVIAYRLLCLGAHYRSELSFSWEALQGAEQALERLKHHILKFKSEVGAATNLDKLALEHLERFQNAIFDDLNGPRALACVWSVLSDQALSSAEKLALLLNFDQVLGLGIAKWQEQAIEVPQAAQVLITARDAARAAKDWKKSDQLRDELKALGFQVIDSPQGTKVKAG